MHSFYGLNTYFIHTEKIVIIMLITIKTLFYWANAYENGFLNRTFLEFSHIVTISHLCKREEAHSLHVNIRTFQDSSQQKTDFLYFSGDSCQKRIKMNIECIKMAIPVLILKPLNQFNKKLCSGAEA